MFCWLWDRSPWPVWLVAAAKTSQSPWVRANAACSRIRPKDPPSIRMRLSKGAVSPVGVTMLIAPPSRAPPKRRALPPR